MGPVIPRWLLFLPMQAQVTQFGEFVAILPGESHRGQKPKVLKTKEMIPSWQLVQEVFLNKPNHFRQVHREEIDRIE